EGGDGAAASRHLEHGAVTSGAAAIRRGAEEVAAAVLDQAGVRREPVCAVKGGEGGDNATASHYLEHRAVGIRTRRPVSGRCAEEVAAAVLDQAGAGEGPVGAVEGGEGSDRAAAGHHLEHRAVGITEPPDG